MISKMKRRKNWKEEYLFSDISFITLVITQKSFELVKIHFSYSVLVLTLSGLAQY